MKDTPILEEELAEVEVGVDEVEVDEVEVGAGCSQVHPSAMLQLSESQVHTIELTSPSFSVTQCTPNTLLGSHLLM